MERQLGQAQAQFNQNATNQLVQRDADAGAGSDMSPWWFIGGAAVLGVVGGVVYAVVSARRHNPLSSHPSLPVDIGRALYADARKRSKISKKTSLRDPKTIPSNAWREGPFRIRDDEFYYDYGIMNIHNEPHRVWLEDATLMFVAQSVSTIQDWLRD